MELAIGVLLLLGCIGWGIYPNFVDGFEYTTVYYLQLAISGFGGLFIVAYQNFWTIAGWVMSRFDKKKVITPTIDTVEEYTLEDFQSLMRLRNKAKLMKNEEAEELIIKLNTLLFSGGKDG